MERESGASWALRGFKDSQHVCEETIPLCVQQAAEQTDGVSQHNNRLIDRDV